MSFILRRIFVAIAAFVGLMTYAAFRGYPWAVDVALCVAYTVEVTGLVVTARLLASQPQPPMRPIKQMLLIHAGFMVGVIVLERIFPLLKVLFPGGPEQHGRHGSWAFLIESSAILLLGFAERAVLLNKPKPAPIGVWAEAVINTPAAPVELSSALPPQATEAPAALKESPAFISGTIAPANASAGNGFSSITGVFSHASSAGEGAGAASASLYANSTGDDYNEFLTMMQQGKRPFRKPGISVKQEYEMWLAHRAKTNAAAAAAAAKRVQVRA